MLKLCLSLSLDLKPIYYPNFLQNFFLCHQNMTINIWIIFSFMYFSLIFVDQNKFSILLFFFLSSFLIKKIAQNARFQPFYNKSAQYRLILYHKKGRGYAFRSVFIKKLY